MSQTGQYDYVCLYLCLYLPMCAIDSQKVCHKPGSHTLIEIINFSMPCLPLSHLHLFISLFSQFITHITFPLVGFPYLSVLYPTTDHRDLRCMMYSGKDAYQHLAYGGKKTSAHTHTVHAHAIPLPSVQSKPIDSPPALLCCVLLPPLLPPLLGEDGRETVLKLG